MQVQTGVGAGEGAAAQNDARVVALAAGGVGGVGAGGDDCSLGRGVPLRVGIVAG